MQFSLAVKSPKRSENEPQQRIQLRLNGSNALGVYRCLSTKKFESDETGAWLSQSGDGTVSFAFKPRRLSW